MKTNHQIPGNWQSLVTNQFGAGGQFSFTHTMPLNPKAKVTLLHIPAILFALAGACALVAAFEDHKRTHIAQSVLWFSLCIVFLANARRNKRKAIQSRQGDSSNTSQ